MLSVIVPTYHERDTLGELLQRLASFRAAVPGDLEVIVVDDGSSDGTPECAEDWFRQEPMGRVIRRAGPRDLARAVAEGIRNARGEFIAVMDADLSHPPELLPALVEAVRAGNDIAVASRYVPGGGAANWSWRRRLLSRAGNLAARPLTAVADATSGYFVIRRQAFTPEVLNVQGFKILLEILARGTPRRVCEVPYLFVDRTRGTSKLRLRVLWRYAAQLGRLYWSRVSPWNASPSPSSS